MTRYHVDTPAQLALVAIALDQSLGLRNAAGAPTPREQLVHKAGVVAPASVHLGPAHQCYDRPGTKARLIDGGDGTAALEIDDDAPINAALGTTVRGVPLPAVAALVQVTRARDNAQLAAAGAPGVRDKLDDAYVDSVYDAERSKIGTPAEIADPQSGKLYPDDATAVTFAQSKATAELQGKRATDAVSRKGSREGQKAIEKALGLGRGQ